MEISSCKNYTPHFQARPIAKTINRIGNLETGIDLWAITHEDKVVLNKIVEKTNIKKLMPDFSRTEQKRWEDMLAIAVDDTISLTEEKRMYNGILAVTDNKPCGIMSYKLDKNNIYTSCVCTWPIEVGKKVKFAGKTLFYQLFKMLDGSKAKTASLHAIHDGPYPTVPRYQVLGYNVVNHDRLSEMKINKPRAKESCKKLQKHIEYTPVENGKDIDLSNVLVLD